jgi:hypothetical protein
MSVLNATIVRRNRRISPTRARRTFVAAIAVAGLAVAAWGIPAAASSAAATSAGRRSAPGVTPTSVLIGSDQPLTGVSATGYGEIAPASRAFFEYVNAHGGVHGRAIDYAYGGIVLRGPVYVTYGNGPILAVPPVITSPPHHF